MIIDITKFEIISNRYVTIHAIKEVDGGVNMYETKFECGSKEEDKPKFEVLANLQYNQETFDYINSLDVEWSLLEED
tara:strand:- start:1006 stop:1236 length:231 start_codon:yes stop_codon:yes gene_type:complete